MPTLVETLAAQHLGGSLPADFIEILAPLDGAGDEAAAFLRRMFALMERARFQPRDCSLLWARQLAALPGVLPGSWDGMPPPATFPGRHRQMDDYLAANPWRQADSGVFIDIGCGFPPLTALDTARRFPDLEVVGIDPAFGRYIVRDEVGAYACFSADLEMTFIWGDGTLTPPQVRQLWADLPATRERFRALFDRLRPALPPGEGPADVAVGDCRIERDPLAAYATQNARFMTAGFGSAGLPSAGIVRAMNVLMYFDRAFQDEARRWVGRLLAEGGIFLHGANMQGHERYGVWRRQAAALEPVEFALGAIELRPLGLISWYSFSDDDPEALLRADVLAALASDDTYRAAFDAAVDAALSSAGFCERRADGYLDGVPGTMAGPEITSTVVGIERRLIEGGWVDRAAEVLTRATGRRAWRNAIGHLAVDPVEWGWEPIALE